MNKKTLLGIVPVLLAGLVFFVYRQLGGFSETKFNMVERAPYHLVGKAFEGNYNSPKLELHFYDVKKLLEDGLWKGDLVVVNYELEEERAEKGEIRQFIGILLDEKPGRALPDDLCYLYLPAAEAVTTEITAHNLVMPKANDIRQDAQTFAASQQRALSPITVEKYFSDKALVVELRLE